MTGRDLAINTPRRWLGVFGGVFVLWGVLALVSCGSGGSGEEPRRDALVDLAGHVIVPTYRDLSAAADEMAVRAAELETAPNPEALDALRASWRTARSFWKRSQAFQFGPAETLRTAAKLDWSPIRESRIESALSTDGPVDGAYVEDLGANQKGFMALEYLIFDAAEGDGSVAEGLLGEEGGRRRRFVRALCDNLSDQAFQLYDAWRPEGGGFIAELSDAGRESEAYPTLESALDELLNQMIFLSEEVAHAQLRAALGADGEPDPTAILGRRSDSGRRDALDGLISIQNTYLAMYPGQAPFSLAKLVRLLNADTEKAIRGSIVRSIELVAAIPEPLTAAVAFNRDQVTEAQLAVEEVMRRLEIDLISILGGTLRFNPGDGD